jgi:hypothetical protein
MDHTVQLFDDADSLAHAVSAFLHGGFLNHETLLVAARKEHWDRVAACLRRKGVQLEKALESGQLTVRNAADALKLFTRRGALDRAAFNGTMGAVAADLAARGRPIRIYGELVDLLAAEGNMADAERLETWWNELVVAVPFKLFCGYSSVHFGDPRSAASLRAICAAHARVHASPRDILGSFLLHAHAARGHAQDLNA